MGCRGGFMFVDMVGCFAVYSEYGAVGPPRFFTPFFMFLRVDVIYKLVPPHGVSQSHATICTVRLVYRHGLPGQMQEQVTAYALLSPSEVE